tara:strand:- start:96 stop:974 length:879 start_codon:yes stop_codon:yes gene_type:complete
MIILDLNQVMISNMMAQIGGRKVDVSEDLLRHMVLNSIRAIRQKFYEEYGELVIAVDDRSYWRRDYFPYYKAQRKNWREQSGLDWAVIFEAINKIRDELRDNFPYKYIMVDGAEADDIIGTLCKELSQDSIKNIIVSGDKDFIQLQKYPNVEQYDPVRKRMLKSDDPRSDLIAHIMSGDKGDGVPNVLSKDDCFINGRQKPLRKTFIAEVQSLPRTPIGTVQAVALEGYTEDFVRNYKRNEMLIDLDNCPNSIRLNILEQYNTEVDSMRRPKLMTYFIDNRLKGLMEHIGEF